MLLTTKHLRPFAPFGVWAWELGTLLAEASAHAEGGVAGPRDLSNSRAGRPAAGQARGNWKRGGEDDELVQAQARGGPSPPGPLYCNVTHAGPVTTLDLALANAERLMRLGDLPCDRNPGCARVACVDNSAVLVCNDTPARVRPAYSLVVAYVLRIVALQEDGGCTFWGPKGDLLVNGQLFNATAGWNVIVTGQNCCGTATTPTTKMCGPFPSAGVPDQR